MRPVARKDHDRIHFARGDTGLTLCGRPCTGPEWEAVADHEVIDALFACMCRACERTTAWQAS